MKKYDLAITCAECNLVIINALKSMPADDDRKLNVQGLADYLERAANTLRKVLERKVQS